MTGAILPYSTARGFCQGAYLMMSNEGRYQIDDDSSFVMSFYHLVGFAVELYLKAFLIEKGMPEKQLMHKPYGHNLHNLLVKAIEEGFVSNECCALVKDLEKHETYEYRYMKNNSTYTVRNIGDIFKSLSALDNYIARVVNARALVGRKPDTEEWRFPESMGDWRGMG